MNKRARILRVITVFAAATALTAFPPFTAENRQGAASFGEPLSFLSCENAAWAWGEETINITFDEMYGEVTVRGIALSDKLKGAKDKRVSMVGFMAPPLTPTINFFVLTRQPMSLCPFCSSDADWPPDIVVVKLREPVKALPYDKPIRVTGILELGTAVDEETGFVSLVRIASEKLEAVK